MTVRNKAGTKRTSADPLPNPNGLDIPDID